MKKIILIMLLLVGLSYGQAGIFGTIAAPSDTTTLTNTTALTSRVIKYNAYPEGVATLFLAADTTTGNPGGIAGQFRFWYGKNVLGQEMYGPWRAMADSVLQDSEFNTAGTIPETDVTGRDTDLASETGWMLSLGVQFKFTGVATHTSLLLGYVYFY